MTIWRMKIYFLVLLLFYCSLIAGCAPSAFDLVKYARSDNVEGIQRVLPQLPKDNQTRFSAAQALEVAIYRKNQEIFDVLVESGITNKWPCRPASPFAAAAKTNDFEKFKAIVDNSVGRPDGCTIAPYVAKNNNIVFLQYLLEWGASANEFVKVASASITSAAGGYSISHEWFDIDGEFAGLSALGYALQNKNSDMVHLLLENGASPNMFFVVGELVIENLPTAHMDLLLQEYDLYYTNARRGFYPEVPSHFNAPGRCLSYIDSSEMDSWIEDWCQNKAVFFLKSAPNPIVKRPKFTTPLVFATGQNDLESVRALLKNGADIDGRDSSGNTVYDYLENVTDPDLTSLLERAKP